MILTECEIKKHQQDNKFTTTQWKYLTCFLMVVTIELFLHDANSNDKYLKLKAILLTEDGQHSTVVRLFNCGSPKLI